MLKFELNCVLKFGTAPTPAQCVASGEDDDGATRRRRSMRGKTQRSDTTEVTVSFPVSAEGDMNYSDGIATAAGKPKSADSGGNCLLCIICLLILTFSNGNAGVSHGNRRIPPALNPVRLAISDSIQILHNVSPVGQNYNAPVISSTFQPPFGVSGVVNGQ